jgi:hypothetical protein
MINTQLDILTLHLFLLDKPRRQSPTPRIHHIPLLLPSHRRMQTQILPTGQSQRPKILFSSQLLFAVGHQVLELCEGLFDFGHCAGAVDEFAVFGVEELVGDDEGEERDCFSRAGGAFEDGVAASVEGLFEVAHVGILFCGQLRSEVVGTWVDAGIGEEDLEVIDEEPKKQS